ncbi:tyrosine-protein phosphatase [uncultured Vagococcus sp.]|uniref:tyrosine-protein phosphatase n=1 Tax=uncultured Vagococcus sp. TaxID=189676 RepID=UPI0028D1778C|nr:tyrosine-protein phosphatase [uncultured Vagococcus sp.]
MDKRYVNLEGTFNFRDIGGYQGLGGRKVKYGQLYRSDELSKLTPTDVTKLSEMGIKTIIDYRNEKERLDNEDLPIPGARLIKLDPIANIAALAASENNEADVYDLSKMTAKLAKELMTVQNREFVMGLRSQEVFKEMLELVMNPENTPLVQHCRGGKDRTGYGIALILLLLGVSREEVMADYLLTNYYKKDKNESSLNAMLAETGNADIVQAMRYFKEANELFLKTALDIIDHDFGGIEGYVKDILQVTDDQIDSLRNLYLE